MQIGRQGDPLATVDMMSQSMCRNEFDAERVQINGPRERHSSSSVTFGSVSTTATSALAVFCSAHNLSELDQQVIAGPDYS